MNSQSTVNKDEITNIIFNISVPGDVWSKSTASTFTEAALGEGGTDADKSCSYDAPGYFIFNI